VKSRLGVVAGQVDVEWGRAGHLSVDYKGAEKKELSYYVDIQLYLLGQGAAVLLRYYLPHDLRSTNY
jgi:hypothetical protein